MLDKMNSWLQLLANCGILASLVLVLLQLQQATQIARAQMTSDAYSHRLGLDLAMMGENPAAAWARAARDPAQMTDEDLLVVAATMEVREWFEMRIDAIRRLGLWEGDRYISTMELTYNFATNPAARAWIERELTSGGGILGRGEMGRVVAAELEKIDQRRLARGVDNLYAARLDQLRERAVTLNAPVRPPAPAYPPDGPADPSPME